MQILQSNHWEGMWNQSANIRGYPDEVPDHIDPDCKEYKIWTTLLYRLQGTEGFQSSTHLIRHRIRATILALSTPHYNHDRSTLWWATGVR
jgi:hypothetical protein